MNRYSKRPEDVQELHDWILGKMQEGYQVEWVAYIKHDKYEVHIDVIQPNEEAH